MWGSGFFTSAFFARRHKQVEMHVFLFASPRKGARKAEMLVFLLANLREGIKQAEMLMFPFANLRKPAKLAEASKRNEEEKTRFFILRGESVLVGAIEWLAEIFWMQSREGLSVNGKNQECV